MTLAYVAVFSPYEDKEDGFVVTFPDLPGCVTGGDTLAEAIIMAEDAASGWVLGELEDGNKPPKASSVTDIKTEGKQFTSVILLDMDAYTEKYGVESVEKTLTIPAWMNTYAEEHNISCSKVLQDSISRMMIA